MSIFLENEAVLSAALSPDGSISAALSQAPLIINDWVITVEEIENGKRLIARRGSEEQIMDVMDGAPGDPGKPGKYYIPNLDTNGYLTFTSSEPNEYDEYEVIGFAISLKGPPGKTPVKGKDYFTAADVEQITQSVLAQVPDQKTLSVSDDGSGNISLEYT